VWKGKEFWEIMGREEGRRSVGAVVANLRLQLSCVPLTLSEEEKGGRRMRMEEQRRKAEREQLEEMGRHEGVERRAAHLRREEEMLRRMEPFKQIKLKRRQLQRKQWMLNHEMAIVRWVREHW
jgi:hypothetical protein